MTTKIDSLPQVSIVIPIYKHSGLLIEAIESSLLQECPFAYNIILVNDGCPFESTHKICKTYAELYSNKINYIKKVNGGLSSARNAGVNFALKNYPNLRAIYFLDADNRISPCLLKNSYEILDSDSNIGWVYPNIDMFGFKIRLDYGGKYSRLIHTKMNICEAGSLVSTQVFKSGVYFDESFKLGYEDWEFFLSASDHGFVGKNCENMGFKYRKRPESMLSNSNRYNKLIMHQIEIKHPYILNLTKLVELEHLDSPRYVRINRQTNQVLYATDFSQKDTSTCDTLDSFNKRIFNAILEPEKFSLPGFILFADESLSSTLDKLGILEAVHYSLEEALINSCISILSVSVNSNDRFGINIKPSYESKLEGNNCAAFMIKNEIIIDIVRDQGMEWVQSILTYNNKIPIKVIELELPTIPKFNSGNSFIDQRPEFLGWISQVRSSQYKKCLDLKFDRRSQGIGYRSKEYTIPRNACDNKVCMPIVKNKTKLSISFILPIAEFGGVEKVIFNMAKFFKKMGWETCLVIIQSNDILCTEETLKIFDKFIFVSHAEIAKINWQDSSYYEGNELGKEADIKKKFSDFYSLIHFTDVAVLAHQGFATALAAALKKNKIITINSLHVHDFTDLGRQVGNTELALPYEHAFDYICPCSYELGNWLKGSGVPSEKVIPIQNAAGFELDSTKNEKLFAGRLEKERDQNLNILYIGRLDKQKGLHRLSKLYQETCHLDKFNWRVIGKSVINDQSSSESRSFISIIEPPIHTSEELQEVYDWADIFILLSDYEGLPLSIIEAMRQGVIVLATDVGANSEIITHSVNGFLFQKETCIQESLDTLYQLCSDRDLVNKISHNAYKTCSLKTWDQSILPLYDKIMQNLESK